MNPRIDRGSLNQYVRVWGVLFHILQGGGRGGGEDSCSTCKVDEGEYGTLGARGVRES